MADSLPEMFNNQPGMFSKITDPFTLKDLAIDKAIDVYGRGEDVGGKGDALRHILASAILAKRQGPGYANLITGIHESQLPFVGSLSQAPEDREMDLHNNALGIKLAKEAKDYNDLMIKAKQHIDSGTAKTVYSRTPAPVAYEPIDAGINAVSNWMKPHYDRVRNLFSK